MSVDLADDVDMTTVEWEARKPIGGKESRELARAYAASHPEDKTFREYLDRYDSKAWRCNMQWVDEDENGEATYKPVWTRIVEWHFVPHDRRASKQATACFGKGGCSSGPGSRGSWYCATEHTWTEPVEVAVASEQIAMFA